MSLINISDKIIEDIGGLQTIQPEFYGTLLSVGVDVLEGRADRARFHELAEQCGVDLETVATVCNASADLIWEFSKGGQRESTLVTALLTQMSLPPAIVDSFAKVFYDNRTRIAHVRSNLSVSGLRFRDMSWRLDVEVARRNISNITEPKFMIRLDVSRPDTPDLIDCVHLQADYANLKRLQTELQRALNEMQGVHAQRLSRYMT